MLLAYGAALLHSELAPLETADVAPLITLEAPVMSVLAPDLAVST
jgi:hypothetical protein